MITNEDGIQLEENDDATNPAHDTKNTPKEQEEDGMQNNSNNTSSFRLIHHIPWRRTLIGIGIYLFIGCLAYRTTFSSSSAAVSSSSSSSASKFSIIDGVYYTVTCLTTIGYGDLTPQTNVGKVSTALFGMTSLLFWSTALGRIGAKLIDVETSVTAQLFRTHKKHRVYQYYETEIHKNNTQNNQNKNNETITTTNKQTSDATARTVNETTLLSSSSSSSSSKKQTWSALPLALMIKSWSSVLASWWTSSWKGRVLVPMLKPVLVIVFGGGLIGTVEGWTWFDSIYYGFVTATTMGLGDYCPQSKLGRMVSIIVIPTLLTAAGEIFATLTRASIRHKQRRAFEQEFFHNNTRNTKKTTQVGGGGGGESSGMTQHTMAAMDLNHDGKVSRAEYVLYMLMEMDIVRDDDVKELRNQFTQLDVTKSGYIEEEDFRIMEERRKNTQASLSSSSSSSSSSLSLSSPSPQ